ncbi:MAG: hypothetical protein ACTSR3_23235, partial [Candidatus Helarchaeota archaeon]
DEMKLVSLTDSLRELKKIIDSSITDLTLDILTTEVQILRLEIMSENILKYLFRNTNLLNPNTISDYLLDFTYNPVRGVMRITGWYNILQKRALTSKMWKLAKWSVDFIPPMMLVLTGGGSIAMTVIGLIEACYSGDYDLNMLISTPGYIPQF